MDKAEISKKYESDKKKFDRLGADIIKKLKNRICDLELFPEITYRVKETYSLLKKIFQKSKQHDYGYEDVKDKLGIRITCLFLTDVEIIGTILNEFFQIRNVEHKRQLTQFDHLDYQSDHYDVSILPDQFDFDELEFVFEIQIRTINQNAWACASHHLYYKQDVELSHEMKRKIFRLLSLYEIADDELSKVNTYIKEQSSCVPFLVLSNLKGKFHKYAKVDYNQELALSQTTIILDFFDSTQQHAINENILSFIEQNNEKIIHIYKDNASRYSELLFLTQPEIFLIWYCLDKYKSQLEDNWGESFYEEDLTDVENLW